MKSCPFAPVGYLRDCESCHLFEEQYKRCSIVVLERRLGELVYTLTKIGNGLRP
jgi:hypothetical protein